MPSNLFNLKPKPRPLARRLPDECRARFAEIVKEYNLKVDADLLPEIEVMPYHVNYNSIVTHTYLTRTKIKQQSLNRWIWERVTGETLTAEDFIVTKNYDPFDLRFANLFKTDRSGNAKHSRGTLDFDTAPAASKSIADLYTALITELKQTGNQEALTFALTSELWFRNGGAK